MIPAIPEAQSEQRQTDDTRFEATIYIPLATNPLNLNQMRRMHWATKGRLTKQWRQFVALKAARYPHLNHAEVTLTWFVRDNRRRDSTNLWGLFKPLADGLVDAGVLTDDTDEYLTAHCTIKPATQGALTAWMELAVTAS